MKFKCKNPDQWLDHELCLLQKFLHIRYIFYGDCTHVQYIVVIVHIQLKPPITPSKTQVNAANTPNDVSDEDIKDTEVCTVFTCY